MDALEPEAQTLELSSRDAMERPTSAILEDPSLMKLERNTNASPMPRELFPWPTLDVLNLEAPNFSSTSTTTLSWTGSISPPLLPTLSSERYVIDGRTKKIKKFVQLPHGILWRILICRSPKEWTLSKRSPRSLPVTTTLSPQLR